MPASYLRLLGINGRNGIDSPLDPTFRDLAVEAINVDRYEGLIARRRGGSDAIGMTGGTAFSTAIDSMFRRVPGTDETAAELWAIDHSSLCKRVKAGAAWANVTFDDAISTRPQDANFAVLNNKLYIAYDSAQDRLHAYDELLSKVRRVGLPAAAAAPTVANTGGGAYAALIRYYRVRWLQLDGTTIIRRSEASPSVAFTPSGAGTAARVTQPTVPGEGETHWEVEGSPDNFTFYVLAGIGGIAGSVAIGTTTYDDSNVVSTYPSGALTDLQGYYTLPTSVKYVITDGNRLVMAGNWEAGKSSRYWWTPNLGAQDKGDDERIVVTSNHKNYDDIGENSGGGITGLGGPANYGIIYAFKYREIWQLTPTGDNDIPYTHRRLTDVIGAIDQKSIFIGEDEQGRATLQFWSVQGPYRLGAAGLQYLGRDIEDITATINLAATNRVVHGCYFKDKHQVTYWIATGASNDPDTKLVFDTHLGRADANGQVRRGWFKHTGTSAAARCSCLFSNTIGASMSRDLKPFVGLSGSAAVWKLDTTSTDDAGTPYQAYVKTRPIVQSESLGSLFGVGACVLVAKVATGVSIQLTLDANFGKETRTFTTLLTAEGTETRVIKPYSDAAIQDAVSLQVTLGDAAAVSATQWSIDELLIPAIPNEPKAEG